MGGVGNCRVILCVIMCCVCVRIKGKGVMETYWLKGRKISGNEISQNLRPSTLTEDQKSPLITTSAENNSETRLGIYKEFVRCEKQN
ncbi:hypothetical protein Y032_0211g2199 [Ancylostoma ceylanicum]|uniref:Guanylate cyclase domain-containing protein n=1 Tax=Ancylostoma ceylanicum TaxID=53326 RepID=A0A016SL27_9BILA|nr:hypothetical protein Y032_0211g2199 [Ancylostoma ceylanicum]